MQFQSGGHVLGFVPDGMYVSNGTYALRVEFVEANAVAPQAANSAPAAGGAAPQLAQVTYPNLWPGITLAYDAEGGMARSTYTLAPGADPAAIRLRYNAPVTVNADGSLWIAYETGEVCESAPLAWQKIGSVRVAVEVAFTLTPASFSLGDEYGVGTGASGGVSRQSEIRFRVGYYDSHYPLTVEPTLTWHTFLGGSGYDDVDAIAVDGGGNVYVVGTSDTVWGSPVRAYASGYDAFVSKLASDGRLTWNTFLGGNSNDWGDAIAVDGSGNVYVVGDSGATWGSPVRAYTSGDAFVAKLGGDGSLIWHTFLGGSGNDWISAIAVDDSENVYVAGRSVATWGNPVRPYIGYLSYYDAFAAKLASDGRLTWNTFLGGGSNDWGTAIAVDGGNVYVAGHSTDTWGSPVRAYTDYYDAFAVKLRSDGNLIWHTFLGGSGGDWIGAIAVDSGGNVYAAGTSENTWASPVRAHAGGYVDAFAAKLGGDGSVIWNTFLGGNNGDHGYAIAVDDSENVYVAGYSGATWGSPVWAYAGGYTDAFAAKLGSDGSLTWNTFLGGDSNDWGAAITVDDSRNIYVAGDSGATWGGPVRAYTAGNDAFVAKIASLMPVYLPVVLKSH